MIWWPTPYKAPNFTDGKTLLPPKPITAQSYKKPKERLQQGDWSNVTNEPVAPFALNTIVQGSKPILPIKQVAPATVTTPQIYPQPVELVQVPKQLPTTGAWKVNKDVIKQLWADIIWWTTFDEIKTLYPELSSIDDNTVKQLWADILWWTKFDDIIKLYPELWINQPTQSFKTATQTQPWWWMFDYQVFWKLDPNSVDEASVWWFAGNVWKSAVNMISDVGNMITNPVQTAKWLWWMVAGASVNAAKFLWKEFLGKTEEEMNAKLQSKIDKWGIVWMLASTVKWAEKIADSAWEWAVVNRYGSLDAAKRTAYEDPVGFISDIATLVTWVGGAVKWWATAVTKIPMIAKSSWTVSRLWKVADIAWDIAKVADYADPANLIMKGYIKAWEKAGEWAKAITKIPWKVLEPIMWSTPESWKVKYVAEQSWINPDNLSRLIKDPEIGATVRAMRDAWENTMSWVKTISDAMDQATADLKTIWNEYNAVKSQWAVIPTQWIKQKAIEMLNNKWFDIVEDSAWWYQLKKRPWTWTVTPKEMQAIKWVYDEINDLSFNDTVDIDRLHQSRITADKNIYDDLGRKIDNKEALDLRNLLDSEVKSVPWMSELDSARSELIKNKKELQNMFFKKTPDWYIPKDNLPTIINNALKDNNRYKLEALEKFVPWITKNIEALSILNDVERAHATPTKSLRRNIESTYKWFKEWSNMLTSVIWGWKALVESILFDPRNILEQATKGKTWWKTFSQLKPTIKWDMNKLELAKAKVAEAKANAPKPKALEFKPQTATPITPAGKVQEKIIISPKKLPKSQTIIAEKWTAVSPAEQAKFKEKQAKQQEIITKKQQIEQAKQQTESFEKKASDYQKVLEDSKDYKKLWVFDVLWGWWVRDWDYVTKYWIITDTQRWMSNLLEYKIWDKRYKARDIDVFEKWVTPEIIPIKESGDIVKARQDIKDMQADKQRRNLYVNQLLEEMNLKSVDDLPADKLPEFAKILRTRNRSWEWMTRYENFVKENKTNKWSAIADKKVKIPIKKK